MPMYRLRGTKIDIRNVVAKGVTLHNCHIGKWNYIGPRTEICDTTIGNYCCIAPAIGIGAFDHVYTDLSISPTLIEKPKYEHTTIGNDVWIASGVIIKSGVTIGDGAVIGANSFVNKDVPPYAIVAGSPIRIIKYRFGPELITKIVSSKYWDFKPKKAKIILKTISRAQKKEMKS